MSLLQLEDRCTPVINSVGDFGAFVLTQDGKFYLAGMVVAGDYDITYVTPNSAIESATGLHAVIK